MLALQSPVILMVMNRTNGATDAGIFSIAIAVANLMMYVGQYGIRRFQASDINEQASFREYHGMRIITCIAMVIVCFVYCVVGMSARGYSSTKAIAIYLVCMLKLIQAYSDVFHGNMQQKGRLDVATKASTIRYTCELLSFCGMLLATHDLVKSAAVCVVVSLIVMLMTSFNVQRHYCDSMVPVFHKDALRMLFVEGFPLFVSMFLNIYVGNAPKYAIDAYLTDDVQAIFNFIFMPAFVVQIVTQFIFNPLITSYAEMWLAHTRESFDALISSIRKMCVAILGLTVFGLVIAATIGIPVLAWLFGADLSGCRAELCIIMLGGGLLGYSIFFMTVIAIIRIQQALIGCYGAAALFSLFFSGYFVREGGIAGGGITGASWLYVILMLILAASLLAVMVWRLQKEKLELSGSSS